MGTTGQGIPGLGTPGLVTPGLTTPGLGTPGLGTPGLDTPVWIPPSGYSLSRYPKSCWGPPRPGTPWASNFFNLEKLYIASKAF